MTEITTQLSNYDIAQRLRPYNLHFLLSLKFNGIVYEQVAVVVAVVFPKLSYSDTLRLVSSQENYPPVRIGQKSFFYPCVRNQN